VQEASATAEPRRRSLGEGAAQEAPTAPHATPRADGAARTGPERFWARWPVRIAFALCLVLSCVAHGSVVPFGVPHGFEVRDVEGEGIIPIDVVAADEAPPPPPPPPPVEGDKATPTAPTVAVAQSPVRRDAGVSDAASDAGFDAVADAAADAPVNAADHLDGAIAVATSDADGGRDAGDPEALLGAESVRADVVLVTLVVNAEVIRRHPVGARLGYLLRGIPQWDDFMSGTDIDPVRDTDWVLISGPSLRNTSRDMVLIHYSAPDRVVDRAVQIVSGKYEHGGPFDAGVPGVKASLAHADRAERVILRPRPHLLAVVPPSAAHRAARALVSGRLDEHIHPGEAMYLRLLDPHHPMPEIPESITEMRMRILPTAGAGADVWIEGDTRDQDTAAQAAEEIGRVVRRHNDAFTSLLTHGLLDHVGVGFTGSTVKVHLAATRDQIETVVTLVGDFLGVQPPPAAPEPSSAPGGPAGSSSNGQRPR
jgi:hypothetical protein